MLYWLPIFFILCELVYLQNHDKLIRIANISELIKKYKSKDLEEYALKEFKGYQYTLYFLAIFLVLEGVYFFIGFFYPIWMISLAFILYSVIGSIRQKIKGPTQIEKTIQLANLKDFETSDIKFNRLLKLQNLKNTKKIRNLEGYIVSIIKIIIFMAIIVCHYHLKIL